MSGIAAARLPTATLLSVSSTKFKVAPVGAASGIANECSEARLASFRAIPSIVQALNCEVIFSFSDCWNDEDVGIFLKVLRELRAAGGAPPSPFPANQ